MLDLNHLAKPYEQTNSLYYIENFTKLIESNKLILKEIPDVNSGKIKIYSMELLNCKNILVEDCIESFNDVCSKK